MSEWTVITARLNSSDDTAVRERCNRVRATCRDASTAASACRGLRDDELVARIDAGRDESDTIAQTVTDIIDSVSNELSAAYAFRQDGALGYAECDIYDGTGSHIETITGNNGENGMDVQAMVDARYDIEPYRGRDIIKSLLKERYGDNYPLVEALDATVARLQELQADEADENIIQTLAEREREKLRETTVYDRIPSNERNTIADELSERNWSSARSHISSHIQRKSLDAC